MKSKVTNFLLLALVLSTVLLPSLTVIGKKPQYCEKWLDYYIAGPGEPYLKGEISGLIEGYFVVYHLDPLDEKTSGQVVHCRERWAIYEDDSMSVKLLSGTNTALVNMGKGKWWAQGVVKWVDDEFEDGRYADFYGSRWHSEGIFIEGPVAPACTRLVDTRFIIN